MRGDAELVPEPHHQLRVDGHRCPVVGSFLPGKPWRTAGGGSCVTSREGCSLQPAAHQRCPNTAANGSAQAGEEPLNLLMNRLLADADRLPGGGSSTPSSETHARTHLPHPTFPR